MNLTVAELFAGVGGFRVGLNNVKDIDKNGKAIEKGDWKIVYANQYEPSTKVQHAYNCYTTRFGKDEISNEDIHWVNKKQIPVHSLLVGGFPCQDYSVARSLTNEKGIEGKKGVLFWDIKNVLIESKTPFVILENVDRLLKSPASQRGRDFSIMLKTFDDLGYSVEWRVINAAEYGMPQKRKRIFIFAFKKNTEYFNSFMKQYKKKEYSQTFFNDVFPIENHIGKISEIDLIKYNDVVNVSTYYNQGKYFSAGYMVNGKVIHFEPQPVVSKIFSLKKIISNARLYNKNIEQYVVDNDTLTKFQYLKGNKRIERVSKTGHKYVYSEGSMAFPDNLELPGRTMLTSEGTLNRSSHIIYDEEISKYRIITEIECELLQMFPPNWTDTMPKRSRYFMMGNALVTGIISKFEPKIKDIILKE